MQEPQDDDVMASVRIRKNEEFRRLEVYVGEGILYVYPDQIAYKDWNQLYEQGKP